MDPASLRFMGKGYDFGQDRCFLPEGTRFDPDHHITPDNLANTLFQLFAVESNLWRPSKKDEQKVAPVLQSLLV